MKKLALSAAALILSASASFADPVEGVWKTQPGDTGGYLHVTVSKCGEAICGVIKQAYKEGGAVSEGYEHLGKRMLWDMQAKGEGAYAGGKIWAPDRNKTYKSKMSLNGNTLKVSGCVAVICRSQSWQRVK
ncbi:DUF2147 domain-containing protein [uncultured Roseovarius sp.]|uniref:DUF2147 domain-containing protein n=1 Tax=uncultured Roseovarius sp. TaxID=293344 RepID=UPI00260F642C|nr:DUF2147 domain-containing protein [uncultured Roseovarius sp.]